MSDRLVRWLIRLYPKDFREAHAENLQRTYTEMMEDGRRNSRTARLKNGLNLIMGAMGAHSDRLRRKVTSWNESDGYSGGQTRKNRNGRGGMSGGIWKDLAIAARNLARRPGFSLGVILTLGLGIGATTTIFGVVDGVILRPLPYDEPSELVAVGAVSPTSEWLDQEAGLQDIGTIRMVNYQSLRERARSLETLATINIEVLLRLPSSDGSDEAVDAPEVSPALFDMLGVTPVLGRTFLPEEYAGPRDR